MPSSASGAFRARNVVATSQPLAVNAGVDVLRLGGNAADAAVATAIALVVVEPTNNGVGSDSFAMVWDGTEVVGLNASGRSPAAMTYERYAGQDRMPGFGWESVTVPGAVSGWVATSKRFGRLPFAELFKAAIAYARDGFPVSPVVASQWELTCGLYADYPEFAAAFLPNGRPPKAGEVFRNVALADSLEEIACTVGESFYRGDLARRIVENSTAAGGPLELSDLADHEPNWVQPLAIDTHGVRLLELPPNSQGIAALIALGILENTRFSTLHPDDPDAIHLAIEALKLGFADTHRYAADPAAMEFSPERLLEPDYLALRSGLIDPQRASEPTYGVPRGGDTVYLCAADADGMMVSFIQTNFFGFGSGIVVPGTGISLQNRASGFSLDRGHPNCVAPRKRPFHTNMPGMVLGSDGKPDMVFGVMGAEMQPQGHLQMMARVYGQGLDPQAAAAAGRWRWEHGRTVSIEEGFASNVRDALKRKGHVLQPLHPLLAGGAQLIRRTADGYIAGSEPRKDGKAAGF
ncbi:MAG: gamma-glutamyltranspeptidase/glutathione hydrolase [Hyphomicrobiaceae bacterium]|jgi:gamma-glutamyltranspeptidase/glutathione hydrolase